MAILIVMKIWLLLNFIINYRSESQLSAGSECSLVSILKSETRSNHKILLVLEEVKGIFKLVTTKAFV